MRGSQARIDSRRLPDDYALNGCSVLTVDDGHNNNNSRLELCEHDGHGGNDESAIICVTNGNSRMNKKRQHILYKG